MIIVDHTVLYIRYCAVHNMINEEWTSCHNFVDGPSIVAHELWAMIKRDEYLCSIKYSQKEWRYGIIDTHMKCDISHDLINCHRYCTVLYLCSLYYTVQCSKPLHHVIQYCIRYVHFYGASVQYSISIILNLLYLANYFNLTTRTLYCTRVQHFSALDSTRCRRVVASCTGHSIWDTEASGTGSQSGAGT